MQPVRYSSSSRKLPAFEQTYPFASSNLLIVGGLTRVCNATPEGDALVPVVCRKLAAEIGQRCSNTQHVAGPASADRAFAARDREVTMI